MTVISKPPGAGVDTSRDAADVGQIGIRHHEDLHVVLLAGLRVIGCGG
jgi:hypothetical protein